MNPDMLSIIPRLSREESKVLMLALAEHMRAIDLAKANPIERKVLTYTGKRLPVSPQPIPKHNREFQRSAELFEKCWGFED